MALIDVPAKLFDPATRDEAIDEAAEALGLSEQVDQNLRDGMTQIIDGLAPMPPEDVADYLDVCGRLLAIALVGSRMGGVGITTLFGLIQALDARVDALEA